MKDTSSEEERPWWEEPPLIAQPSVTTRKRRGTTRRNLRRLWRVVGPPLTLITVWVAFSGWSFVAEVALKSGINPLALTLERELFALVAMFLYARWIAGPWVPSPAHVLPLFLLGLLSFGNTVCAIEALKYTPDWAGALAQLCVPAVTLALSWLVGTERPQRLCVAGVATATVGAFTAQWWYSWKNRGGGGGEGNSDSAMWWVGLLLLVVQTGCLAGLAVTIAALLGGDGGGGYQGGYGYGRIGGVGLGGRGDGSSDGSSYDEDDERCPPAWITFWYYAMATAWTAAACGVTTTSLRDLGLRGEWEPWAAMLYGAVVVSCFNWNAITWALSLLPPTLVMTTITLQPLLTGAMAVLGGRGGGGGGAAAAPEAVGAAAVLAGLVMVWVGYDSGDTDDEGGIVGRRGGRRWNFKRGETKPLLGGAHWADAPFVDSVDV